MGKFAEFMDKVMADEAAKAEFEAVIGARKERELSDEDFQKIAELSEKLGAAVTLDEVKDFFTGNGRELSEEELAGITGGSGGSTQRSKKFLCPLCGEEIRTVTVDFIMGTAIGVDYERKRLRYETVTHLCLRHRIDMEDAEKKAEEIMNQLQPEWERFILVGKFITTPWESF